MDQQNLRLVKESGEDFSSDPLLESAKKGISQKMTPDELRELRAVFFRKSDDIKPSDYNVADKLSMLDKGQLTYFNILGFIFGPAWLAYFKMTKRAILLLLLILTVEVVAFVIAREHISRVNKIIFILNGHFVGLLGFRWLWKYSNTILNKIYDDNLQDYEKTMNSLFKLSSHRYLTIPICILYFVLILGGYFYPHLLGKTPNESDIKSSNLVIEEKKQNYKQNFSKNLNKKRLIFNAITITNNSFKCLELDKNCNDSITPYIKIFYNIANNMAYNIKDIFTLLD